METEFLLKIKTDEKYEFFFLYDTLGDLQKEIWKKVVWWCKKYPNAHPSQSRIAKSLGCSREHVNRTFKKFKEFNWLSLTSRGHKRAKTLIVSNSLLQIDLAKREYFKKVEITSEITHSYSNTFNSSKKATGVAFPEYIDKLNISWESKLKLSILPKCIYEDAYEKCMKMLANGWYPDNDEKYFVGTAIKLAKNEGRKIDWKLYYDNKEFYRKKDIQNRKIG